MSDIASLLDDLHLEDLNNRLHPSIFDENDTYNMFIIRLPVITNEIQTRSFGFVLTDTNSYYYDKDAKEFETLDHRFENIHKMINPIVDKLMKKFTRYQDHVADLEDNLYQESSQSDFLTRWLGLKRDILQLERMLTRSHAMLEEFCEFYETFEEFPVNHFADIQEHLDRILRSAAHQLSKLDYIYNYYKVQTNEKMNRMVYLLTVISAIFLPLNLVVGFFGMNTSGLFFTSGSNGTVFALFTMMLFSIVGIGSYTLIRKRAMK